MSEMLKIYVQSPRWFIRPRNTDWRYVRLTIPRLSEWLPGCEFYKAESLKIVFHANWRYTRRFLYRKAHVRASSDRGSLFDRNEFLRTGCQLVFCHDDYPYNADSVPVVWQNSILDPQMKRANGIAEETLASEVQIKKAGFARAAAVQVSTDAEKARLSDSFPEFKDKFFSVPFFLPNVRAIEDAQLNSKLKSKSKLNCIFIGHEARRKGLGRVYAAFQALPDHLRERLVLTVVSSQTDGRLEPPSIANLTILPSLPFEKVQDLLRVSDILLMPSFFESYGLIFLEAMAQATIPIVPNWEVQREIVDYGKAGVITNGEPLNIAQALELLLEDQDRRTELAINAKRRYQTHYAPEVVAERFRHMFRRLAP